MPLQEAELLRRTRSANCQTRTYSVGAIYGINGTDGHTVEKYYWDSLADQGWKVWYRMATNPRPIFCHPDYEFSEVDVMLLYDPPPDVEEYETCFGIYLRHWISESDWECRRVGAGGQP